MTTGAKECAGAAYTTLSNVTSIRFGTEQHSMLKAGCHTWRTPDSGFSLYWNTRRHTRNWMTAMSTKPETTFYRSVHKKLTHYLHHEKMSNPYLSGTPDVWYSGPAKDLWVEYKWLSRIPVKAAVKDLLSPKQLEWINTRYDEGRNLAVIAGCKDGGVLFTDLLWTQPMAADEFRSQLRTREQLAQWIEGVTCCGYNV